MIVNVTRKELESLTDTLQAQEWTSELEQELKQLGYHDEGYFCGSVGKLGYTATLHKWIDDEGNYKIVKE